MLQPARAYASVLQQQCAADTTKGVHHFLIPPPHSAATSRSGRIIQEWEKTLKKSLKVFQIYFQNKIIKQFQKNHKRERHKRKASTNFHLQNDCCFGGRSKRWRKDQRVAEDGGNGGGSSLCTRGISKRKKAIPVTSHPGWYGQSRSEGLSVIDTRL